MRACRGWVALALGGALLAGCTSGGDDPSSPEPSSKTQSTQGHQGGTASTGPGVESSAPEASGAASPSSGHQDAAPDTLTWDEAERRGRELVADLGVEELAGQVIVAGYRGTSGQDAARLAREGFGGVILFSGNVPGEVSSLRTVNAAVQRAQEASGRSWPAVVGIDQEGGPVRRLQSGVTPLPAAMAHGAAGDPALSRQVAARSGAELGALGFTMVFAPDADVTVGPQDPTIGVRSPGSDPQSVSEVALALAEGYQEAGVVPVLKHFPGHGALTTDSHAGLPATGATVEDLLARDLVPFAAAAEHDLPVMVGHIAVTALDDLPATLSPEVIGLLSERLGHDGLVVTDALNMGALDAAEEQTGQDRAVSAVAAGADLVLMPPDPEGSRQALVQAVASGALEESRLREAAAAVVAAALQGGQGTAQAEAGDAQGGPALAGELAAAALTSIGSCREDVLRGGDAVRVVGGTQAQRAALGRELAQAGITVRPAGDTVIRLVDGGDYAAGQVEDGSMPEAVEAAGQTPATGGSADVAVALDTPYALAAVDAPVELATFGDTDPQLAALVGALTGAQQPGGHLPVRVGGQGIGATCH